MLPEELALLLALLPRAIPLGAKQPTRRGDAVLAGRRRAAAKGHCECYGGIVLLLSLKALRLHAPCELCVSVGGARIRRGATSASAVIQLRCEATRHLLVIESPCELLVALVLLQPQLKSTSHGCVVAVMQHDCCRVFCSKGFLQCPRHRRIVAISNVRS